MDKFESLISFLFSKEGYWTTTSYRIILSKENKVKIGRPSCPNWELDVLAYKPKDNLLKVIECKSYLDSNGVSYSNFLKKPDQYKLFHEDHTRTVLFNCLKKQLYDNGLILKSPNIHLCLAGGMIKKGDEEKLKNWLNSKGFELISPSFIKNSLLELSNTSYENNIATMITKIIYR